MENLMYTEVFWLTCLYFSLIKNGPNMHPSETPNIFFLVSYISCLFLTSFFFCIELDWNKRPKHREKLNQEMGLMKLITITLFLNLLQSIVFCKPIHKEPNYLTNDVTEKRGDEPSSTCMHWNWFRCLPKVRNVVFLFYNKHIKVKNIFAGSTFNGKNFHRIYIH